MARQNNQPPLTERAIFIAGTDTAVGKTIVTGLLGQFFQRTGFSVVTQKWIETGGRHFSGDLRSHLIRMKKRPKEYAPFLSEMNPYLFSIPASPHLASRLTHRVIKTAKIKTSLETLTRHFDLCLCEGTGGVFVPVNKKILFIDLILEFKMPVILVAGNRLGAINHTLLTLEALKMRKIKCLGVIFNACHGFQEQVVLKDNPNIIKVFSGEDILGTLPASKSSLALEKAFYPIGRKIYRKMICGKTKTS